MSTEVVDPPDERDLVALDTETTGLAWYERLVEIGAVRFRGGAVIARWRTLVHPQRSIPERVSAIHGITDALVVGAPAAREALLGLQRFCRGATLLAHNARFDRDILATEYARAGLSPPREPMYCTWRLSKHGVPESPRHGLAALAKHLNLPTESPHRALADAELTRRLFLACAERLGPRSVQEILDEYATEGAGAWSLRGVVRRARGSRGRAVSLSLKDGSAVTGVVRAVLMYGDERVLEVEVEGGWRASVPVAEVTEGL